MEAVAFALVLVTIIGWCALAGRLERSGLTSPMVFVAAGCLLAVVFELRDHPPEPELVKVIAEVTLVWVLFADASQVRLLQFRRDLGTYARLLGLGLPLTVALGAVAAVLVLGVDPWAALLLGAALAPTDAALGASCHVQSVASRTGSGGRSMSRVGSTTGSSPRSCSWPRRRGRRARGSRGREPGPAVLSLLVGVMASGSWSARSGRLARGAPGAGHG